MTISLQDYIEKLRYAMRAPGSVGLSALDDLILWCKQRGPVERMAEIGVFAGQSTQVFGKHVPHIVAVDPFIFDYPDVGIEDLAALGANITAQDGADTSLSSLVLSIFVQNTRELPDLTLHIANSLDVARLVSDGSLDLVYIDANHSYECVRQDLSAWEPKVRRGGFVAGHDFDPDQSHFAGVRWAIRDHFRCEPDARFADTSWVYQLPNT